MSVIVQLGLDAEEFELGRVLSVHGDVSIELDKLVPLGGDSVPLFWVHNDRRDDFLAEVKQKKHVDTALIVDEFDERSLLSLDWDASFDQFLSGLTDHEARILEATGSASTWNFDIRFPSHGKLSEFAAYCEQERIQLQVLRIYNSTTVDADPWYGMTTSQREAFTLALESGYYDIPRTCTTQELADQLGISDQAFLERLRRAIRTLADNTLPMVTGEDAEKPKEQKPDLAE